MAYRYTNTDKWVDVWFRKLKPVEKLLFIYLCDNCDIAGFIEYDIDKWAFDIGYNKSHIQGALKGLQRGLVFSQNNECIYICNFLKHQKNLPLNENNKAHIGILRRFELYSYKFNITTDFEAIKEFIEGATKGLYSSLCIGIGNGKGIGKGKEQIPTFEEFKNYALENEPNINIKNLELKYKAWKVNSWKTGKGVAIKNWKNTLLNTIPHIGTIVKEERTNDPWKDQPGTNIK